MRAPLALQVSFAGHIVSAFCGPSECAYDVTAGLRRLQDTPGGALHHEVTLDAECGGVHLTSLVVVSPAGRHSQCCGRPIPRTTESPPSNGRLLN